MTTAYTSLLGLALPVTGELSGTWGDTVNTAITSLLDTAVAGTTSITTDADITLTTTTGASNQARQAILLWNPASGTTTRYITAPAQSKLYTVINASGGTQSIVIRGAGPTTGVTIAKGESATVAWNGSDFVKVGSSGGAITFTDLTVTGNTILGDAAADTLTVNATSTFASPVNFTGQVRLPSTGRSAAAALTTTNPAFLYGVASTYTDTTSSGTVAFAPFYGLAQPTLSTSNVTTYTNAATLYIANAPAAGGSATITNPYALYVAAGKSYFGGDVVYAGGINLNGNVTVGDSSSDTLTINSTITSNLIFTDNTYDIGASGATRPRNLYLSNNAVIGGAATVTGNLTVNGNTVLGDASSDILYLTGNSVAAQQNILYLWPQNLASTTNVTFSLATINASSNGVRTEFTQSYDGYLTTNIDAGGNALTASNRYLDLKIASATKVTVNPYGVGIGGVFAATNWATNHSVLQYGNSSGGAPYAALSQQTTANCAVSLSWNATGTTGDDVWVYRNSGDRASRMYQTGSSTQFQYAGTGTAGSSIAWNTTALIDGANDRVTIGGLTGYSKLTLASTQGDGLTMLSNSNPAGSYNESSIFHRFLYTGSTQTDGSRITFRRAQNTDGPYGSEVLFYTRNNGSSLAQTGLINETGAWTLGNTSLTTASIQNNWHILAGTGVYDGSQSYGSYGGLLFSATATYTGSARRFLLTNGYGANSFAIIRSTDATTTPTLGTGGTPTSGTADLILNDQGNFAFGPISPSNNYIASFGGRGTSGGRAVAIAGPETATTVGGTGAQLTVYNSNGTTGNYAKIALAGTSGGEVASIVAKITNHGSEYGDFGIITRGAAGYSEKVRVTSEGLTLQLTGRTSNAYVVGNLQEWVDTGLTIANGGTIDLFNITDTYDNLVVDFYAWVDQGSWGAVSYRFIMGYGGFSILNSGGRTSAFGISQVGTTYNETLRITNSSGSSVNNSRICLRIWGQATGAVTVGGSDLITSSYMTRIK